MSDLIDRQAALEAILNCSDIFVNNKPVMIDKVDAQEALMEVPTAEIELPIKQKCTICPHCDNCDVNDDGTIESMSDLIDRQAVIDALEKWFNGVFGIKESDGTATIFKRIRELPPKEPKKGKWELKEDILSWEGTFDGYFCSECGKGFLNDLCCNNGDDWVDVKKDFKFCPFCGADMRGETNG